MSEKSKQEREVFWRTQLEAGRSRPGTLIEFCRERGLSVSAYYSWQNRLAGKKARVVPRRPAFLPVKVKPLKSEREIRPIDPKWLSEFVRHLHRGNDESAE